MIVSCFPIISKTDPKVKSVFAIAPRDSRLVLREIQEIRKALEAFNAAVETGEMTGFKVDGMRAD